jgi:hypothetical protein
MNSDKIKKDPKVNEYVDKMAKKVNEYVDENLKEIINWQSLNDEEILHIKFISKSIILARDGILSGSSFVTAIIDNNLEKAITNADFACLRALKLFILVKLWV